MIIMLDDVEKMQYGPESICPPALGKVLPVARERGFRLPPTLM